MIILAATSASAASNKPSNKNAGLSIWLNPEVPVEQRIDDLLKRLTLEEKIRLCHGNVLKRQSKSGKNIRFSAGGIERLGIGQISLLDGRQGIRSFNKQHRTTALPCTLSLSSTWDPALASAFGRLLAEELLAIDRHVLLGPCMNLMRSPIYGRNFENFGEDLYLSGVTAVNYIRGVQEMNIGACACIFVANEMERFRHYTSSNLNDRTLREMSLLPFEMAIKDGSVWSLMAANNLVNGIHNAHNQRLVQDIVKDEFGFDGVVITDWRAAYLTKETALAGIDMATGICAYVFGDGNLLSAVKSNEVPESLIDEKVRRILRLYLRTGVIGPMKRAKGTLDCPEHRKTARSLAAQGMVLLKNDNNLLPLNKEKIKQVLVVGPAAMQVPSGRGSGHVNPPFEITPLAGIRKALQGSIKVTYVPWGQKTVKDEKLGSKKVHILPGQLDMKAAIKAAGKADVVLFIARDESHGEGRDRESLDLPYNQARAISELAEVNPNIVVSLLCGGPVSLEPWADRVPAILVGWYAGQSTGDALADVLTGKVNPGGKLPCTFGKRLKDYPCHALGVWPARLLLDKTPKKTGIWPNERFVLHAYDTDYKEGVFMGYRWFDEKRIQPRFPFGHGLSYTTFDIANAGVKVASKKVSQSLVTVAVKLTNTGNRRGSEVVQVYLGDLKASVPRPPRELKGYRKVTLDPGETSTVTIDLDSRAFAFWSQAGNEWSVEPGEFVIAVGSSSRDIAYQKMIELE
jgi:beta-glucosidase